MCPIIHAFDCPDRYLKLEDGSELRMCRVFEMRKMYVDQKSTKNKRVKKKQKQKKK